MTWYSVHGICLANRQSPGVSMTGLSRSPPNASPSACLWGYRALHQRAAVLRCAVRSGPPVVPLKLFCLRRERSMARHDRLGGERTVRPFVAVLFLCLVQLAGVACQEEGTIWVRSIRFVGVHAVSTSRLEQALATRESSKLPWVQETLLRSCEVRRRREADSGVLRRSRLPERTGHQLRREAERETGCCRRVAGDFGGRADPRGVARVRRLRGVPAGALRRFAAARPRSRWASRAIASWRSRPRNWRSTSCATTAFRMPRSLFRKPALRRMQSRSR